MPSQFGFPDDDVAACYYGQLRLNRLGPQLHLSRIKALKDGVGEGEWLLSRLNRELYVCISRGVDARVHAAIAIFPAVMIPPRFGQQGEFARPAPSK